MHLVRVLMIEEYRHDLSVFLVAQPLATLKLLSPWKAIVSRYHRLVTTLRLTILKWTTHPAF